MLASGKVPHALLFVGPPGVGKVTCGRAVAQAFACEAPSGPDGCGSCAACHRVSAGIHPDFSILRPQGAGNIIAIGEIRELAVRLGYPPHEARARVVILDDADRLTPEASNAFLKTLEEPPPRSHFILATAAPDRLLITILSRCQRILFAPLPSEVVTDILQADGVAPERAGRASALGGGSVTRALALANDGGLERRWQHAQSLIEAARTGGFRLLTEAAAELAKEKDEITPVLELIGLWYRDAAALAAGISAERLAHGHELAALERETQTGSVADLARRAGAVLDAQTALMGYANAQLTLERLMLALRPAA